MKNLFLAFAFFGQAQAQEDNSGVARVKTTAEKTWDRECNLEDNSPHDERSCWILRYVAVTIESNRSESDKTNHEAQRKLLDFYRNTDPLALHATMNFPITDTNTDLYKTLVDDTQTAISRVVKFIQAIQTFTQEYADSIVSSKGDDSYDVFFRAGSLDLTANRKEGPPSYDFMNGEAEKIVFDSSPNVVWYGQKVEGAVAKSTTTTETKFEVTNLIEDVHCPDGRKKTVTFRDFIAKTNITSIEVNDLICKDTQFPLYSRMCEGPNNPRERTEIEQQEIINANIFYVVYCVGENED